MILTPLVEYLLAVPHPKGGSGNLCRVGMIQTTIPIFPAGLSVTINVYPEYGSYCNIQFRLRWSPVIVPGSFYVSIRHAGMEIPSGIMGATALGDPQSAWLDIRQNSPAQVQYTNISGMNQFYESIAYFLVVQSEDDYHVVRKLIADWRGKA